jgi:hypothetical protein
MFFILIVMLLYTNISGVLRKQEGHVIRINCKY